MPSTLFLYSPEDVGFQTDETSNILKYFNEMFKPLSWLKWKHILYTF